MTIKTLCLVCCSVLLPLAVFAQSNTSSPDSTSHYLRFGYQNGTVLMTNGFLEGENESGQPIDHFQAICLDVGWQTNGSEDWHHLYNFPSYGVGIFGADFFNDEELGKPTSLYGFFVWPLSRGTRWDFNFDLAFGITDNWVSYDPVNNPNNTAIGAGRSVHIQGGLNAEYRLAKRWSLIGGVTTTHFSNGGTQLPNNGLNIFSPVLYIKHHLQNTPPVPARHGVTEYNSRWDLTFTGSGGIRNLNLDIEDHDQREEYLNRDYFVGNFTMALGRQFSPMIRLTMGLDVTYDESVHDLVELEAYNRGENAEHNGTEKFDLAAFAGYEHVVNRTRFLLQVGYIFARNDVEGRLPRFYQRVGLKQFFYENWFAGLNVRFHELGSADNLEYNIGFVSQL